MADLRAMSEHVDSKVNRQFKGRIYPIFLPESESPCETKRRAGTMKTTAEQIVRDFRRTEGFNTYEAAGAMRPLCRKIRSVRLETERPFFLKRWIHAINWDLILIWANKAFEWACIGLVIACLIYLGIFVFGPFTIKLIR
jgi:hypothetical protein